MPLDWPYCSSRFGLVHVGPGYIARATPYGGHTKAAPLVGLTYSVAVGVSGVDVQYGPWHTTLEVPGDGDPETLKKAAAAVSRWILDLVGRYG